MSVTLVVVSERVSADLFRPNRENGLLSFHLSSTAASGSRFVLHTSGSGLPWSTLLCLMDI